MNHLRMTLTNVRDLLEEERKKAEEGGEEEWTDKDFLEAYVKLALDIVTEDYTMDTMIQNIQKMMKEDVNLTEEDCTYAAIVVGKETQYSKKDDFQHLREDMKIAITPLMDAVNLVFAQWISLHTLKKKIQVVLEQISEHSLLSSELQQLANLATETNKYEISRNMRLYLHFKEKYKQMRGCIHKAINIDHLQGFGGYKKEIFDAMDHILLVFHPVKIFVIMKDPTMDAIFVLQHWCNDRQVFVWTLPTVYESLEDLRDTTGDWHINLSEHTEEVLYGCYAFSKDTRRTELTFKYRRNQHTYSRYGFARLDGENLCVTDFNGKKVSEDDEDDKDDAYDEESRILLRDFLLEWPPS